MRQAVLDRQPTDRSAASRSPAGFMLLELLISLVVLGIIAVILIPVMLNALDRGRQKRTMADLRSLGGSIEAYSVDVGFYPVGSDVNALETLAPEYLDSIQTTDAWGHQLIYNGEIANYTLGSPGRDGGGTLTLIGDGGPTTGFSDDIIYSTGLFLQWPAGTQTQ